MNLDSKIPEGPLSEKWSSHKFNMKLVNPANRRKYSVIVVGSGLAGGSAAASLAEQGYNVSCFCYQDSPRRAHSIAAQGGINASKNYQNDGDSVHRLFYDTVKGGDYRAREANVYRLSEVSSDIIDQCVANGVPFAREYGGLLANRSFGGAQVSRTFYARGQTGQQLLLGAYSALSKQIGLGKVKMYNRHEMLDLVKVDDHAKGIIVRNMATGEVSRHAGDAVVLATGGYGNVFFLSTNAQGCNVTALTAPTNVVPVWQIPVTLKFTRRAFPSTGTNNRSSHSCLSHFEMTVVSGLRRTQKSRLRSARVKLTQILWPKTTEITSLSVNIRASVILRRGIFPLGQRKKLVTKVAASPALVLVYSSISVMRLSVTVRTRSKSATATSLTCISALRVTILTRLQ